MSKAGGGLDTRLSELCTLPRQRPWGRNQWSRARRRPGSKTGGTDRIWTLGHFGGCLSWGTVVRAEAGAQNKGGPEGEVDVPATSGAWRTTWGSSEAGQGAVPSCCPLSYGQRSPPWLPLPSSLLPASQCKAASSLQ